jgi:hypothetical protein
LATYRSGALIKIGIAIVSIGLFTLLQLPRFTSYEFPNCIRSPGGGEQCIFINPIYLIILIISMTGAVLFFFGLLGRGFILGPFFMLGGVLVALGLAGVIFEYFDYEDSCILGASPACFGYQPEIGEIAIIAGTFAIAVNAFSWYSGIWPSYVEHRITKRVTARIIGIVSVVDGAILFLFVWIPFAVVGAFAETQSISWAQVGIGLLLMPLGLSLVRWSSKVMTEKAL